MENSTKKGDLLDYVLVCDVTDNGKLYYYEGYCKNTMPVNSNEYTEAMKIPYRDEADKLCEKINQQRDQPFRYHVEEHKYF